MTDKLGNKGLVYLFLSIVLLVSGCGGGGSSSDSGNDHSRSFHAVGGGGVKGPLANADVSVYTVDTSRSQFKGERVAQATTNARSAITDLALPLPLTPPYMIEFSSTAATKDLTTNQAPVITSLRSVITHEMLAAGKQVYATPLTTMAVDLAIAKADSIEAPFAGNGNGRVSKSEYLAALPVAASQVASTVGFGLDSSVAILEAPPIIDASTNTIAKQQTVAAYRAAVEALSAVVFEIYAQGLGDSPEAVLRELTADLADGEIDGQVKGVNSTIITPQALIVLAFDPALLRIPNSDDGEGNPILVGEVNRLLSRETSQTGATVDTAALSDGSIELRLQPAQGHPDIDGDGISDSEDAFPTDPEESHATDNDGIGAGADNLDNDGVSAGSPEPQTPTESGNIDAGGNADDSISDNRRPGPGGGGNSHPGETDNNDQCSPCDPVVTLSWDPNPEKDVIGYEVHYSLKANAKQKDLTIWEDLFIGQSGLNPASPRVTYRALTHLGVQQGSICFAVKAYSNTRKSDFSKIVCETL